MGKVEYDNDILFRVAFILVRFMYYVHHSARTLTSQNFFQNLLTTFRNIVSLY